MSYMLLDIEEANQNGPGAAVQEEVERFIRPGCLVEVLFVPEGAEPQEPPEAAWVRVGHARSRDYTGTLESQLPIGRGLLDAGTQVTFEGRHVKAVLPPEY